MSDKALRRRISTMERLDGLPFEAYQHHWAGPHVPIVAGLPGVIRYLQHRIVGERPPGIDGISEVLFETAPGAPTNTHFSAEQVADELAFVSAVTAMPILETTSLEAPVILWILLDGEPEFTVPAELGVAINHRDLALPIMTRSHLRTDPAPPSVLVAAGFTSEERALAASTALRESSPARILVTRTVEVFNATTRHAL